MTATDRSTAAKTARSLALAAATATLAALAAPGAAQAGKVEIVTNPPGASCVVRQQNTDRIVIKSTPAVIDVLTFADGIRVTCRKGGLGVAVYELGEPDATFRGQNDFDDGFFARTRQRRRNVALRRLKKIELDFFKPPAQSGVSRR